MSKELTTTERDALARHEKTISENWQAASDWYDAWQAIKTDKLYREKYKTWEAYCREEWGLTPQTVNRQIRAEETRQSLPKSEHMCSLSGLAANEAAKIPDPEQRQKAVERASERGKPTAKAIRQAAKELAGDDEPPFEATGEIETDGKTHGVDGWISDVTRAVQGVKREIEKVANTPDGIWLTKANEIVKALKMVEQRVERMRFGRECEHCGGSGCEHCRESGWLPQWRVEELEA